MFNIGHAKTYLIFLFLLHLRQKNDVINKCDVTNNVANNDVTNIVANRLLLQKLDCINEYIESYDLPLITMTSAGVFRRPLSALNHWSASLEAVIAESGRGPPYSMPICLESNNIMSVRI